MLLQAGDAQTLKLWQALIDISKRHFNANYAKLGVLLRDEHLRGESFYNPLLPQIADELEKSGLARMNDGALCVFAPGFTNREGEPLPLIVRKQDGGFGYAATDLAALRFRTQTLGGTRLLYVVGAPQAQHLAMVFAVGELAGWLEAARARRARRVRFDPRAGQEDVEDAGGRYRVAVVAARRSRRPRGRGARTARAGSRPARSARPSRRRSASAP